MTPRFRKPSLRLALTGGAALALVAGAFLTRAPAADVASAPSGKAGPAKVANGMPESALSTVELTPDAMRRLGVVVVPVARRATERQRLYTGQIMLPPTAGQSAVSVLPPQTAAEFAQAADAQAAADGLVGRARAQLQGARDELARSERLVAQGVGTGRQVEQAKAQVGMAEADLDAARKRRELLGAPVFGSASAGVVWVRASVYVGDLQRLDARAVANVGALDDLADSPRRPARPVPGPPLADPGGATVNLFYTVDNADRAFRPGQRVGVQLPIRGQAAPRLIIPWSAVVHDAYGGAWVYEEVAPRRYARRRVQVEAVRGAEAVLSEGLAAGAKVVSQGAAEIFGAEFGAG